MKKATKKPTSKYITKFHKRNVAGYCSLGIIVGAHQLHKNPQFRTYERNIYDFDQFTKDVRKAFKQTSKRIVITNFRASKSGYKKKLEKSGWKYLQTHVGNDVPRVNMYALHLRTPRDTYLWWYN